MRAAQEPTYACRVPARSPSWSVEGVEAASDRAHRVAGLAECRDLGDHRLLGRVLDQMDAVSAKLVPVRDAADPLPALLLDRKGGAGSGADQRPLVSREDVDDAPHELVLRGVAIAGAVGRPDARALALDKALDGGRDYDVAREPIALGDQQHAGSVNANIVDGGQQARPPIKRGAARHAKVLAYADQPGRVGRAPPLQRLALGDGAEGLLVGRDPRVADH